MKPKAIALITTLVSAACGGPINLPDPPARAPNFSKTDGGDSADTQCRVVLRSAGALTLTDNGAPHCDDSGCAFFAELDVSRAALDAGAVASLIATNRSGWIEPRDIKPVAGAGSGFQRYRATFRFNTPPSVALIPFIYVNGPGSARAFDHNVIQDAFGNYVLETHNQWRVVTEGSICPAQKKKKGPASADKSCRVVLREAGASQHTANGEPSCDANGCAYYADFDLSAAVVAAGGTPSLLAGADGSFFEVDSVKPVNGAAKGYHRYRASFFTKQNQRVELIPFIYLDGDRAGPRAFDHNVLSDPLANYVIDASNGYRVRTSPTICPAVATDPSQPGPHEVEVLTYDFGDKAFDNKAELRAVVYAPKATEAPAPLVLLLHGRHATCYDPRVPPEKQPYGYSGGTLQWPCDEGYKAVPSFEGYAYLGRLLASHGFVVASISANGLSVNDFGEGSLRRAKLLQRHLDLWRTFNTGGAQPFGNKLVGRIDLDRVGTLGHSVGGEGVVRHIRFNQEAEHVYGLKAVFALAPANVDRFEVGNVPFAVVLPYCDGDRAELGGVHYFDDGRYAKERGPRHMIVGWGENHNFYNTVWTPTTFQYGTSDDWLLMEQQILNGAAADPHCNPNAATSERLSDTQQQRSLSVYASAFFRAYLKGETEFLPLLRGELSPAALPAGATSASFHAPAQDRIDINRFEDSDSHTSTRLGGTINSSGISEAGICGRLRDNLDQLNLPFWNGRYYAYRECGRSSCKAPVVTDTLLVECLGKTTAPQPEYFEGVYPAKLDGRQPHTRIVGPVVSGLAQLSLGYDAGARYRSIFGQPVDVRSMKTLSFRASVNFESDRYQSNTDLVRLRLVDANGKSAVTSVKLIHPLGDTAAVLPRAVLQGFRVPLSSFNGIDLSRVTELSFELDQRGALLLADLAFSN
jgi:hypothetical protein